MWVAICVHWAFLLMGEAQGNSFYESRINHMTVKPHFSEIQDDRECHRLNCNSLGGYLILILMNEYAICSDNRIFVARGSFPKFG